MAGREAAVHGTVQQSDEVRVRRSDAHVYLFRKTEWLGRWVCAVAKRLDSDGLHITVYPTDAINEGVRVWPT